jgi:hypothetical protein
LQQCAHRAPTESPLFLAFLASALGEFDSRAKSDFLVQRREALVYFWTIRFAGRDLGEAVKRLGRDLAFEKTAVQALKQVECSLRCSKGARPPATARIALERDQGAQRFNRRCRRGRA